MPVHTDAQLLEASDRQSAGFFRKATRYPWATVQDDGDVVFGMTGIPLEVFNGATCARFEPSTADARIEAVLRPFREARIDMTWVVGPTSTPPDLASRLEAHGLVHDATEPVLGLTLEGFAASPPAPGIELEWVGDRASFDEATRVMFAGFGMPETIFDAFADRFSMTVLGPGAYQRVVLARIDGRPVSTALGVVMDGVLGIYNVATRPDEQRRGGGTAVTRAVIQDGIRNGAVSAILQTSPAGRPVYERLGFHEVGTVTVLAGRFSGGASTG